jgi:hypothetical protein
MASRNTQFSHTTDPHAPAAPVILTSGTQTSSAAVLGAREAQHVGASQPSRESLAHRANEFLQPLVPKKLHGLMMLLYRQATHRTKVPLPWLLKLWAHGSITRDYLIYDKFQRYGLDEYVSDYARWVKSVTLNDPYALALDDKILFHRMMSSYVEYLPTARGIIFERGTIRAWDTGHEFEVASFIQEQLNSGGRLVLKPFGGSGGGGVLMMEQSGGVCLCNGQPSTVPELRRKVRDLTNYIVTDFAQQADYAAHVYPHSTNTIRVITMWDIEPCEPFIAFALQKFGTEKTKPVDNVGQGGLGTEIDVETGSMGPAVQIAHNGQLSWFDTHPDTGSQITGLIVPNWNVVASAMLCIAGSLPFLRYVGWDIVVTNDGFKILEGNNGGDLYAYQVHRPLLRDPRVKAFFTKHGVI